MNTSGETNNDILTSPCLQTAKDSNNSCQADIMTVPSNVVQVHETNQLFEHSSNPNQSSSHDGKIRVPDIGIFYLSNLCIVSLFAHT